MTAIPALRELARASRSAERLFDTLYRELPPTLESIRLTGSEISDLTDDLSEGVESAGNVVKQVDQGLRVAQRQVKEASILTQSFWTGVQVAWKTLTRPSKKRKYYHTRSIAQAAAATVHVKHQGSQNDINSPSAHPSSLEPQRQSFSDASELSSSTLQSPVPSDPQKGAAHTVEQRLKKEAEQSDSELN
jgi:hypothetical protein